MSDEIIERLRDQLREAKERISEYRQEVERLTQPPSTHAVVVELHGETVAVASRGGVFEVWTPKDEVRPGDGVLIDPETFAIKDISPVVPNGDIAAVTAVHDETWAEVVLHGASRVAVMADNAKPVKVGDRVLLDAAQVCVLEVLPKTANPFSFTKDINVSWEDIGGQEEAKAQMVEAVETPLSRSRLYEAYRKRPVKGVLLHGPPGCGKTMLAKAAATSIARAFGGSSAAFMYVKGPEVLDPYVGVTEANIRSLFLQAREHYAIHGFPAVIFIDEADALLGRRGARSMGMEQTVVPMFLAEMDGLEASNALVILTTNRPDVLDPAITRDGRIDRRVKVGRPTKGDVRSIFRLGLADLPAQTPVEELVDAGTHAFYNERYRLFEVETTEEPINVNLSHLASGAIIANIVDHAVSSAMHRDMAAGMDAPSGLMPEDMEAAVEAAYRQSHDIDHNDVIRELVGAKSVRDVRRVNYAEEA